MLRATLALALVLLMACTAHAAPLPQGTFALTVPDKGTFTLTLAAGKFTMSLDGKTILQGAYTASGDRVELVDQSGPSAQSGAAAKSVYAWSLSGKTLKFTVVKDNGGDRQHVLTAGPWTQR